MDYEQQAEELEKLSQAIDTFGEVIGADLTLKNQIMGRGSSNRAGLKAIADRLKEVI